MSGFYWLASYMKSGNTWLRLWLWSLRHGKPPDLARFGGWAPMAAHRGPMDALLGVESTDLTGEEAEALRPRVFEALARGADEPMLRKVDEAWVLTRTGEPLFPPAVTLGAIAVVRDPRDVAVSLAHFLGLSIDGAIGFMADPEAALCPQRRRADRMLWRRLLSWSGHVESWLDAPVRVLPVRYEDMSADAAAELARIAAFLGWPATPDAIAATVEATRFDRLRAQEDRNGFSGRPAGIDRFFRRGTAGGWRDTLTAQQAARIERDHGAVMARLGYR